MGIRWEDRKEHFIHFPEHVLFDVARNESIPLEFRKFAVELMHTKGYKKAFHPELVHLLVDAEEPVFEEIEVEPTTESKTLFDGPVTVDELVQNIDKPAKPVVTPDEL